MNADFRAVSLFDVPPVAFAGTRRGIAVDLGTTTVVLALVEGSSVVSTASFLNPQRLFGRDVLSRVRAATQGRADRLRSRIVLSLSEAIAELLSGAGVSPGDIELVAVAGNTAMCHFLLGLPCDGLGIAPFTPHATRFPDQDSASFFACAGQAQNPCPSARVSIVPCVGAFIGGDIVAGLVACGIEARTTDGPANPSPTGGLPDSRPAVRAELFIDIGTNAEMVLAVDGALLCASAAAGPAFEGGSVSCGTGSVAGAVSSVRIDGKKFAYEVIGGVPGSAQSSAQGSARDSDPPPGICGSGLLDFLSCALEAGLVNRDGSLAPVCAETGVLLGGGKNLSALKLTAEDVRVLQLAKAAIRASIGVLLRSAGIDVTEVFRVHLAGGFGLYLSERSALVTGLLPAAFAGKIRRPGNTSLAGAVRCIIDPSASELFDGVASRCKIIQLADDASFGSFFIDAMEFGDGSS